jgi:hypothetical protein
MKKLSLDLAELRVESFETAAGGPTPRGTVRGNALSDCCTFSCAGTCGIQPPSTDEPALPTRRCETDETNDMTGCQPCCV